MTAVGGDAKKNQRRLGRGQIHRRSLDGEALKGKLDSEPIDGLPWPLVYMRVPPLGILS